MKRTLAKEDIVDFIWHLLDFDAGSSLEFLGDDDSHDANSLAAASNVDSWEIKSRILALLQTEERLAGIVNWRLEQKAIARRRASMRRDGFMNLACGKCAHFTPMEGPL